MDYVLRMIREVTTTFDGDVMSGLIFLAAIRANGQHLAEPVQQDFSSKVGVIPDEARRPASAKSIADSLGLPYETVRRRLVGLCADGWCLRVPGQGYVVPEEVLLRADSLAVMARNHANFQMMFTRALRAGLDLQSQAAA